MREMRAEGEGRIRFRDPDPSLWVSRYGSSDLERMEVHMNYELEGKIKSPTLQYVSIKDQGVKKVAVIRLVIMDPDQRVIDELAAYAHNGATARLRVSFDQMLMADLLSEDHQD